MLSYVIRRILLMFPTLIGITALVFFVVLISALLTLPVLQLMASGFNFWLVVLLGRPHFNLPFRSLEEVLAATPLTMERKSGGRTAQAAA